MSGMTPAEQMLTTGRMMDERDAAHEELRALLAASGLTQRAAAEALGMSQRMLQYNLAGAHAVERRTLLAMRWVVMTADQTEAD